MIDLAATGLVRATAPTVVFFPGLSGDSPGFASLRAELGGRFRSVTVSYPRWQDMAERAATLDFLVEAAVRQIGRHAPDGELQMVGYSLGGAVAYETAARLAAQGRETKALVILDTPVASGGRGRREPNLAAAGRFARDVVLAQWRARLRACRVLARCLARSERLARVLARTGLEWLPPSLRFAVRTELVEAMRMRVLEAWVRRGPPPRRARLRGVVFRSQEKDWRVMPEPDLGWSPYLEWLELVDVTGDHVSMLRPPHLAELARKLAGVLSATGFDIPSGTRRR